MKKKQKFHFIICTTILVLSYPFINAYHLSLSTYFFTTQSQPQTFFDNVHFSVSFAPINTRQFVYQPPLFFVPRVEPIKQVQSVQPHVQNEALELEQKKIEEEQRIFEEEEAKRKEQKLKEQKNQAFLIVTLCNLPITESK